MEFKDEEDAGDILDREELETCQALFGKPEQPFQDQFGPPLTLTTV